MTTTETAHIFLPQGGDPIDIRSALKKRRDRNGHKSSDGYTCSNIIEMIDGWFEYRRQDWATYPCQTLPWAMNQQIARLERGNNQ